MKHRTLIRTLCLGFTLSLGATGTAALAQGIGAPLLGGGQSDDEQPKDDGGREAAPATAEVYFIEPADGATVESPVRVRFGLRKMGVAPAGVQHDNTGHHHVLIDDPDYYLDRPLPKTDQIRHFGGGHTEGEIELEPGRHTLQLLLGDFAHRPHDPPVRSKKITIHVPETD